MDQIVRKSTERSLLKLLHVSRTVGLRRVLNDVSMEVQSNEIVCVCGPRGAGKKKLVELILGLDASSGSQILFEGKNIFSLSPAARERLGIVSPLQTVPIWYRFRMALREPTIFERLDWRARRAGYSAPMRSELTEQALSMVDLSAMSKHRMRELSAGMRLRAEMAEMIVARPKLIVLDEPYKQLDRITMGEFDHLLNALKIQMGVAVLLTDRSGDGAPSADRVYHISEGKLLQPADLDALPYGSSPTNDLRDRNPGLDALAIRRVFISYSRSDTSYAKQIVNALTEAGIPTWFDQNDIRPGDKWDAAIEDGLRRSSHFLVILSTRSVTSQNVLDEFGYALDEGRVIVPVKIEPCNIPLRFRRVQHVDVQADQSAGLGVVVEAVQRAMDQSTQRTL